MSIWVRLIDGPNNGAVHKVDEDQPYLDCSKPVPQPIGRVHRNFGLNVSEVSIAVNRYTRRAVNMQGNQIVFFAPENLSDLEAVQSVLGP